MIEEAICKWKSKLNKPSLLGKRVRSALLPQLSAWFNRSHKEGLTYRTTQIITEHGCFADFLFMIGKVQHLIVDSVGIELIVHNILYNIVLNERKNGPNLRIALEKS